MEVLPLITGHDVEMMRVGDILHILGIDVERQVVGVLLVPAVATIVVQACIIIIRRLIDIRLTRSDVGTSVHVDMQVLKAVDLIVGLNVAKVDIRLTLVGVKFKDSNRVLRCCVLDTVCPITVEVARNGCCPLPVAGIMSLVGFPVCPDGFRRIHAYRMSDGSTFIGIMCLRVHELTIDVERQVVVQE